MADPERATDPATSATPVAAPRRIDGDARRTSGPACWAPERSLYFDQLGDVRACCQNITGSIGNIRLSTIREIWDGERAKRLRAAVGRGDLSLGCDACAWQIDATGPGDAYARAYDFLEDADDAGRWPRQMEFSLSNACNLQCEMCTGWSSSAIRAQRERLPPLVSAYGDAFFEELAEFLPHLERAIVLGGEPFIAPESLRLLEMLADLDEPPEVIVITNGTQWSRRVERILERLPMAIDLSLDGATASTFESIRVGARLPDVLANLDRYSQHARRNGKAVGIAFCLMTSNWHEFASVLELAERRGVDHVSVNLVTAPLSHSLYRLDADALARTIESMERDQRATVARLERFAPVWERQLAALRERLALQGTGAPALPRSTAWEHGRSEAAARSRTHLRAQGVTEPIEVHADGNHTITWVGPGVDPSIVGRPLPGLLDLLAQSTAAGPVAISPGMATSELANEFVFEVTAGGRTDASILAFLFHEGDEVVALLGVVRT